MFSTQASVDSLFESAVGGITEAADVLVIGFEDGTLHLSIYDSFEVGLFQLPSSRAPLTCRAISYSHSPFSSTHALLGLQGDELQLVPIDLRLLYDGGNHMSLLASRSSQLKHLLKYVRQAQKQVRADFISSQTLPTKFVHLVEEELKEQRQCTFEQAAYHLIMTGNCFPEMKEWLVDQIGERVSDFENAYVCRC